MKRYRVDFFNTKEHLIRYFDTETEAIKAGQEGVRDGYKCYLLEHVIDNKYDVVSAF